jgi:glycosyltransferase involved in cell wall biosynthesis
LLEALSLISRRRKDFALDIVGDGPYKREYEELTRKLGLDGTVKFHGVRTGVEVARFMMDCDFLVQPSLWETFGVVYIEAMACGKPVIASNIPGPNEFINADVGILVPPKDVDALAKAINFMLDHHGDYSSEKVSRYARERFSCEVVGRMLNEVYEEVAATSGGGRSI